MSNAEMRCGEDMAVSQEEILETSEKDVGTSSEGQYSKAVAELQSGFLCVKKLLEFSPRLKLLLSMEIFPELQLFDYRTMLSSCSSLLALHVIILAAETQITFAHFGTTVFLSDFIYILPIITAARGQKDINVCPTCDFDR